MTDFDWGLAHVVAFEQKQGLNQTSYKGIIFINAENTAWLQIEFEVAPRYNHR